MWEQLKQLDALATHSSDSEGLNLAFRVLDGVSSQKRGCQLALGVNVSGNANWLVSSPG